MGKKLLTLSRQDNLNNFFSEKNDFINQKSQEEGKYCDNYSKRVKNVLNSEGYEHVNWLDDNNTEFCKQGNLNNETISQENNMFYFKEGENEWDNDNKIVKNILISKN